MSSNHSRNAKSPRKPDSTFTHLKILQIIFVALTILMAIGMARPWRVIWFLNIKNRLNVLIVYGIPWIITLLLLIVSSHR